MKMNDEYIANHDIVRRYLKGKLTPEETVEFEEYILDKPELLEQLEVDSMLVETLPEIEKDTVSSYQTSMWWKPIYSNLTAVAACCTLLAVLVFNNKTSDDLIYSPQIVYLENYRSGNETSILEFRRNEDFKVVAIDVPPNTGSEFELNILDREGNQALSKKVYINGNNEVVFLLHKQLLYKKEYSLRLHDNGKNILAFNLIIANQR